MQILNISVLNRPARYLTTKTYPLYFTEEVGTSFALSSAEQRTVMNETAAETENVETSVTLISAFVREVMNSSAADPESMSTSFGVIGATVEANNPYHKTTILPEKIKTLFILAAATQKDVLVKNAMQPEKIKTSFALVGAQITN